MKSIQVQSAPVVADTYTRIIPAIRGIQAGREYFVTMLPLKLLASELFIFTDNRIPPELRAQRILNKGRVPEIVRYVINNPRDYTFSAITASIDKMVNFTSRLSFDRSGQIGDLIIPMDARFLINDGQHRRAAIEQVVKQKPELAFETIPVVLFVDAGLSRSQQMFADLNKYTVRPTRSLGVLYDHTDPMAKMVRDLIVHVPLFVDRIEKESTSISFRSKNLFTLSAIYQATMALLGKTKKKEMILQEEAKLAKEFWLKLGQIIPQWKDLVESRLTASELRQHYVHSSGVALVALAMAGRSIIHEKRNWPDQLSAIGRINWSKENPAWEGRAMVGGRLSKTFVNVILTSNFIKQAIGVKLTENEQTIENNYLRSKEN